MIIELRRGAGYDRPYCRRIVGEILSLSEYSVAKYEASGLAKIEAKSRLATPSLIG